MRVGPYDESMYYSHDYDMIYASRERTRAYSSTTTQCSISESI